MQTDKDAEDRYSIMTAWWSVSQMKHRCCSLRYISVIQPVSQPGVSPTVMGPVSIKLSTTQAPNRRRMRRCQPSASNYTPLYAAWCPSTIGSLHNIGSKVDGFGCRGCREMDMNWIIYMRISLPSISLLSLTDTAATARAILRVSAALYIIIYNPSTDYCISSAIVS